MTSAPFSLSRLFFYGSLSLVATFALSVNAQQMSRLDGMGDPATFMRPTGASLAVEILESDRHGITLQARPARSGVQGPATEPLSYSALIGIPAGPIHPIEVRKVASIRAGRNEVETEEWDGPIIVKPGSELASLEVLGWLRYQRIARLVIRPWMIEPHASESAQLRSITLRITFTEPSESKPSRPDSEAFERVLRHGLVNYEIAKNYRSEMQGVVPTVKTVVPDPADEHVVLNTVDGGLHNLKGGDLRRAGVDIANIVPRTLKVFHLGRELALQIEPAGDHLTDTTSVIFFAPETPKELAGLSRTGVFGLTWSGDDGLRMMHRPAFVGEESEYVTEFEAVRRVGEDVVRNDNDREIGDRWFWRRLSAEQGAPDSCFLVIPEVESLIYGGKVVLTLTLHGLSSVPGHEVDHHIRVNLNNRWSKDFFWKGKTPFVVNEVLSSDLLVEGDNVVEVIATGELEVFGDHVLVDWLELSYPTWGASGGVFTFSDRQRSPGLYEYQVHGRRGPEVRVFEITDPYRPVLITDPGSRREDTDSASFQTHWNTPDARSFALTSVDALPGPVGIDYRSGYRNLNGAMAHADLVVITHPALRSATAELLAHRKAQGLDVIVLTTEEVYAFFSHGYPTPKAIRGLTGTAMIRWPRPAPSFLLLVGDASNDPLNRLGYGADNLVPTYVQSGYGYPSDSWFGLVSGDDPITDLQVGRLSARSSETIKLVADKIVGYEGQTGDQAWKRRVLLVADDDVRQVYLEEAQIAGGRIAELGFDPSGLYLDELGFAPDVTFAERVSRTDAVFYPRLRDAINRGVGLIHYFGHGGYRIWAREHILDARPSTPHLDQLTNSDRLPVVLSFSCINAAFDTPRFDTIAERLVSSSRGGAVAFWGSGGNNNSVVRWAVAAAIRDTLDETEPIRLGTALALATLDTLRANGVMENGPTDTNILIGDPATVLSFPLSERVQNQ